MSVQFDVAFEKGGSLQSNPFSFTSDTGTISGSIGANSNRVLIAEAAFNASVTSVTCTWDGVSMTPIGNANTSGGRQAYLFGLINPNTGAKVLSVNWTGAAVDLALGAVSVYNADQATGWKNNAADTGTGNSAESIVSTASGNMCVVAHVDDNASSVTINVGNSAWIETAFNGNYGQAYKASASGSETVSWTLGSSVPWANYKLEVMAAAGAPSAATNQLGMMVGVS